MYRAIFTCTLLAGLAFGQAANQEAGGSPQSTTVPSSADAPTQKTIPIAVTRAQRLGAAKTVLIRKLEGSEIPLNVISDSIEGWGRYTLVSAPEKADLVIEITAPEEQPGSVTLKGSRTNPLTGYPEQSSGVSRNISSVPIKMTVLDARTRLPLWSAIEQPKRALKQKSREDNLVEAAQMLFTKFHQAVEPRVP